MPEDFETSFYLFIFSFVVYFNVQVNGMSLWSALLLVNSCFLLGVALAAYKVEQKRKRLADETKANPLYNISANNLHIGIDPASGVITEGDFVVTHNNDVIGFGGGGGARQNPDMIVSGGSPRFENVIGFNTTPSKDKNPVPEQFKPMDKRTLDELI